VRVRRCCWWLRILAGAICECHGTIVARETLDTDAGECHDLGMDPRVGVDRCVEQDSLSGP
jgi:hypothetical protein